MSCRARRVLAFSLVLVAGAFVVAARDASGSSRVKGDTVVYTSPGGVEETCVALTPMPGGAYTDIDRLHEKTLCGMDFYGKANAVCPKIVSTSAGTFVYDLRSGPYAGNPAGFEHEICARGEIVVKEAAGPPASFKMSVNASGTSGTYSTSSLAYYHFSRYFDTSLLVPVSVYRSMDKDEHLRRVTRRGIELSSDRPALRMNHAAWLDLERSEVQPDLYRPTDELFTFDRRQVWGVLLHPQGHRYGAEVSGTRASGWGEGQSLDFEKTAPFLGLRSEKPIVEAIGEAVNEARLDPKIAQAMPADVSAIQVAFWMRAVSEIAILDHVLSQQDRIGNIDYVSLWYWVEGGELRSEVAEAEAPPAAIAPFAPLIIRRTRLNDNDAGVRLSYANFARESGMVAKLRHLRGETYRRLIALDKDVAAAGPLHEHIRTTFGLSDGELQRLEENVRDAAATLRATCKAGKLRFDLDPEALMRTGAVTGAQVDCDNP